MKNYVQFLEKKMVFSPIEGLTETDECSDALGSDGVFILDGRNSLNVMIDDARKRLEQMNNIKSFVGFKIMKGSRFDDSNVCMYAEFPKK